MRGARIKLGAVVVCALWLGLAGGAQAPSLQITPLDPLLSVARVQQFGVTNAVLPTSVSAGGEYTCTTLSNGTARCTGRNQFRQLADGTWNNSSVLVTTSLTNVSQVVAGDEFACALLRDGTVSCWGLGESGQRGDGLFTTFADPAVVGGISGATALASGYSHACVLLTDRSLQCWGRNDLGELGTGTFADPMTGPVGSAVPVAVTGISNAVAIATGAYHTCAVLADATVQCWGANGGAQLGDGTITSRATPAAVPGVTNAIAVTGGGAHTCALRGDGTVLCWGDNEFGQLGDGTGARGYSPVQVAGVTNAVAIAGGWRHTCAILADGSAWCWGQNEFGQLGDGTTTSRATPVRVLGIPTARNVTAGWWHHSCALLTDGSVWCWGANDWGQHGNGTTISSTTPMMMVGAGISWTSSSPAVATIDSRGLATAVDSGTTTINATDASGAVASTTLTVRPRALLSVARTGGGGGSIISDLAGIVCGVDCSKLYDVGTTVTLTATPNPRSTFRGWSGCDSASGLTCTVTVNAATTVTARFELKVFALTVAKTGLGAPLGTVTWSPQGADCGGDCSQHTIDTVVTLTASPSLLFTGWTGCDSVSGNVCTVKMSDVRSVTAAFLGTPQ